MADRIGAIGRLHASPSGTFRQLGGKRAASVLWKAVVKGDSPGVDRTLEKNASRQVARHLVASAKAVLTDEGKVTQGLDGLSRLLKRTLQNSEPSPFDDPAVLQAYRLALFDAAWDATIGKGKLGIRLTVRDDMIKAEMRSKAGEDDWTSVGKTIRDLQGKSRSPHEMSRTVGADPAKGLTKHEGMPPGVSVATGSNYRVCDLHSTEWQAPAHVALQQSFDIWSGKDALAFSFGSGGLHGGSESACKDLNRFLLSGEPIESNRYIGGYVARPLPDGDLLVTALPRKGQTLLAFYPGQGFVDIAAADLSKPLLRNVTLPQGAFLVSLSDAAGDALGRVGAAALDEAMGPEKRNQIAKIGDLQNALSELIAAGTMKAIERKEKALEKYGTFKNCAEGGQLETLRKVQPTVDMINAMLDGAYPHPDAVPREGRVSMNQTKEEFQDSVRWCAKELPELRWMMLRPLGGSLTIAVVDPIEALGIEPTAAKPPAPAPQPVSPEAADFLSDPDELHAGGPLLKIKPQPLQTGRRDSTGSSSSDDDMDFDLADYV